MSVKFVIKTESKHLKYSTFILHDFPGTQSGAVSRKAVIYTSAAVKSFPENVNSVR